LAIDFGVANALYVAKSTSAAKTTVVYVDEKALEK